MLRFALILMFAGIAEAAPADLFARLTPADLAKCTGKNASISRDEATKAVTIRFSRAEGDAELRIPVRALGWPVDWSAWRSIQYTFETTSIEPVSIAFDDGVKPKAFLTEPLPGIRIFGVIPFESFTQTRAMTPLAPLGYKVWMDRLFTFQKVEALLFRMRYPSRPSEITIYNFTLRDDVPADNILDKKPLIDAYGQWKAEDWPGKAHNDQELRALWDADRVKPASFGLCPLGGDPGRTLRASGFFRVEKTDGRWLFVDPHGHPFFSTGMDLVGHKPDSFATSVKGREYLFESLPAPGPAWLKPASVVSFYVANIMRRFGEGWEARWREHIVERLKNWGFNTIANWSDYDLATHAGMPYALPLQGWVTKKMFPFPWNFPDVFSREFEKNVDAAARRQTAPLKDDANLIGWFIGNEPTWARSFGSVVPWPDMVLADPAPSATKAKLEELLKADPANQQKIKDDFLYTCAHRYFEVITAALRRHDPNHLVLGIRFAENPNNRWVEMSRMFDVFSVNIYSKEFMPDAANIRRFGEVSGKPVLIGEFTACAPGRGMQGLFYWGHKVRDYAERGKAYRYYVEHSAADPYIIGTHWFQLVDDLPTGRPSDEERLNYGFLNVLDLPYPDLVEAAQQVQGRVYDLKAGKAKPYDEKPGYN
ncbi:MAG TPA: hypothetical protein VGH38_09970 [Bryobacteraceae bacterium]|jgi:hypothetical protein